MEKIKFKSMVISVLCMFGVMALLILFFYIKEKEENVIRLSPEEAEMLQEMIDEMYNERLNERLNESNSNRVPE